MALLLLAGCTQPAEHVPTETPAAATQEPSPTPEPTPEPVLAEITRQVIVESDVYHVIHNDPAEGKDALLDYTVISPVFIIEDRPLVQEAVNSKVKELDTKYIPGEGVSVEMDCENYLLSVAEANFNPENVICCEFTRIFDVVRCDDALIELKFINTTVIDETEVSEELYRFDAETGEIIDEADFDPELYPEPVFEDSAEFQIMKLEEGSNDLSVPVIDLVNLGEDAETYAVTVKGTGYNARIYSVAECDGELSRQYTVWYCNIIADSAVQITGGVAEGIPTNEFNGYYLISEPDTGEPVFISREDYKVFG